MTLQKILVYLAVSMAADYFLQLPQVQQLETQYGPQIPTIVAIALLLAAVFE